MQNSLQAGSPERSYEPPTSPASPPTSASKPRVGFVGGGKVPRRWCGFVWRSGAIARLDHPSRASVCSVRSWGLFYRRCRRRCRRGDAAEGGYVATDLRRRCCEPLCLRVRPSRTQRPRAFAHGGGYRRDSRSAPPRAFRPAPMNTRRVLKTSALGPRRRDDRGPCTLVVPGRVELAP